MLRNIGALDESAQLHQEALAIAGRDATAELPVAAFEDLAEISLLHGDLDDAESRLAQASALIDDTLVFGWRLGMKRQYIDARIALARGDAVRALDVATALDTSASAMGVPRYAGVARLLAHRARQLLGVSVDLTAVEQDLDLVDGAVAIEAWWLTGETGAQFGVDRWVDRAAGAALLLAENAGTRGPALRTYADSRVAGWRRGQG